MRTLTLILALLIALPLYAKDVYKWTNEEGVVIYSDTYQPGAERIHVSGSKSSDTPNTATTTADQTPASTEAAGGYEKFEILTPGNEETVRSNEGVVPVGLSLTPALAPGHGIQVLVDGVPLENELKTTQFTLTNLNRGTHTLEAKIVDADGAVLMSAFRINFHLRKASINTP